MNKLVNGVAVEMTQEEIAQWQADQAPSPQKPLAEQVKDHVAAMDPAILLRYSGDASLIGQFLNESNLAGAAKLLQALGAKMQAANDTEALAAAEPVIQLLSAL